MDDNDLMRWADDGGREPTPIQPTPQEQQSPEPDESPDDAPRKSLSPWREIYSLAG